MSGTVVIEGGTNWLEDNDWILNLAEKQRSIVAFIGNLSGTAIRKGATVPVWDDMSDSGWKCAGYQRTLSSAVSGSEDVLSPTT